MAGPDPESLAFLTPRHAVRIDSSVSVEECCLAVGKLVGCNNILSADRMNKNIVIFVRTVGLANSLVESGVEIRGVFTPVLPLYTPKTEGQVVEFKWKGVFQSFTVHDGER